MYCCQCGVRLADTEKHCPLCSTPVYHPEITRPSAPELYPKDRFPATVRRSKAVAIFFTVLWVLALLTVVLCDLQLHRRLTWSGYVTGALGVFYAGFILPAWFSRPNPVIFVPCGFAVAALYVLYIDLKTGGGWFLPFAFPVLGGLGLLVTALITVLRYVPGGKLFTVGGFLLALSGSVILVELLMEHTFRVPFLGWSLYPMAALCLVGGFLIFLGICRPARQAMEQRFFF